MTYEGVKRIGKKKMIVLVSVAILAISPLVYALVAITINSTVTVYEPLILESAGINAPTSGHVCGTTSSSATCTVTTAAGEDFRLLARVSNLARATIVMGVRLDLASVPTEPFTKTPLITGELTSATTTTSTVLCDSSSPCGSSVTMPATSTVDLVFTLHLSQSIPTGSYDFTVDFTR